MAEDTSKAWAPPIQKVLIGAITGMVSSVIIAQAKRWLGVDILTPEVLAGIPVMTGFIVAYLVPVTKQEIVDRTTDETVRMANADQANSTRAKIVDEKTSQAEAIKDIKAGTIPEPAAPPPGLAVKPKPE